MKKENKDYGYIYLWKSCKWMLKSAPLFTLWGYILLNAAHKRTEVKQLYGKKIHSIILEPGQLLYGHDFVAEKIGVSRSQIRSAFAALIQASMLTVIQTGRGQLVTVTNWASYQCGGKNSAPIPAPIQAPIQHLLNKEINKLNNSNYKTSNKYSPKTVGPSFQNDEEREKYYSTGESNEN